MCHIIVSLSSSLSLSCILMQNIKNLTVDGYKCDLSDSSEMSVFKN